MSKATSAAEFEQKLEAGQLAITLIGMSNVGKSYWSERLAKEAGFRHYCCDDLIEAEVSDVLTELGYAGGIADMAKWLGQPYDPQFAKNQQIYLDLEIATMQAVINQLEQGSLESNLVIDTTGSVVHTNPEIGQKLKELTTVVYLEASADMQKQMFELYIAEPKPVVWGDIYQPDAGEAPKDALARCYPKLLAYRSALYDDMAQVTIPRPEAMALPNTSQLLEKIKQSVKIQG